MLLWSPPYVASWTLERTVQLASVAGAIIAAAALGLDIVQHRRARATTEIDEEAQRGRAAAALANAVRHQWEEEARIRMLRRPAPLQLRWWTTERPVASSAETVIGDANIVGRVTRLRFHGHSEEVGEKFAALPHHRLVILGEPGAGKTVLAMLLALELLNRWRPGDPVPVLLPIATWDPTNEHLHTWMARRLTEDYPALGNVAAYGRAAAQRLIISGQVLAILDGLDELPAGLHGVAVGELDRAHADRPLVVTCRSEEYEQAVTASGELLTAAAVVELLPVLVDEAIRFLQRAVASTDTRWEEVFEQLRADPDGALAQALSSPLMVALARTVYAGPDREPRALIAIATGGGRAAVERHLLDNLVAAVYTGRPAAPGLPDPTGRRHWGPGSAERYLAFLARQLHKRDALELAWWDLHLALPLTVRLLLALIPGLLVAFVVALLALLLLPILLPDLLAPVAGLLAGLLVVLWFARSQKPAPSRLNLRIRGRLRALTRSVRRPLLLVLGTGLAVGYLAGSESDLPAGDKWAVIWTFGLLLGLVGGFGVGLLRWLREPADSAFAVTPRSILRSDRIATPILWISIWVSFALMLGLSDWLGDVLFADIERLDELEAPPLDLLARDLWHGLTGSLTLGLYGLAVAFIFSAWGWFAISRAWLALRGQVPWRLMTFLDDAHRRGVLRQTGGTYQFRHILLQERLAIRGRS